MSLELNSLELFTQKQLNKFNNDELYFLNGNFYHLNSLINWIIVYKKELDPLRNYISDYDKLKILQKKFRHNLINNLNLELIKKNINKKFSKLINLNLVEKINYTFFINNINNENNNICFILYIKKIRKNG